MGQKPRRLLADSEADYLDGLAAGRKDAGRCNDTSDVRWYQQVVFDNLWHTRPHYVAGYTAGFDRTS
ncbi:MAG: hypothetical protein AB7G47_19860 [Mycolicibacterium sp.]|uniref:hypothetical protein n=1 Tax=Mycolicibacterium sp. TaxID=2320850 RepID=UPI003D1130F2